MCPTGWALTASSANSIGAGAPQFAGAGVLHDDWQMTDAVNTESVKSIGLDLTDENHPEVPGPKPGSAPLSYDEFGTRFMDLVLHRDRVMESINRVLGEEFHLGPIGAGPSRKVAKVTANGVFGTAYGEALNDVVGYNVNLPVNVSFNLDLGIDMLCFDAELVLPLRLTMDLVEPLTILWRVTPPHPDAVVMTIASDSRRAAVLQKLTGLDNELRRFIVRFVERELEKPHVVRAMRIDLVNLIDNAWEHIASQFLPSVRRENDPA